MQRTKTNSNNPENSIVDVDADDSDVLDDDDDIEANDDRKKTVTFLFIT